MYKIKIAVGVSGLVWNTEVISLLPLIDTSIPKNDTHELHHERPCCIGYTNCLVKCLSLMRTFVLFNKY